MSQSLRILTSGFYVIFFPSNLLLFGAGTKHTTNIKTLLLKSFCVTRKKGGNHVGDHESID